MIFELRQYRLKTGQRERWVKWMEQKIIPYQVALGVVVVGSFIADHAKTGIGTLLNSGAYLGLGSNIFGGGMQKNKFIPSFAWGNREVLKEYSWDKFIETAQLVMQRRGVELLNSQREILKKIFELTKPEREAL